MIKQPDYGEREMKSVRIMIVDDHPIVRQGLAGLVNEDKLLSVCCEAEDSGQALQNFNEYKPDFIILDISLRGIDGIELTKMFLNQDSTVSILIMSMHDETIYAERALRAGAKGYIMKQEGTENVIEAIHRILSGEIYLSKKMNTTIIHNYITGTSNNTFSPLQKLTDREIGIFELIGQGFGTKKISEMLHLSVKTVETHKENIKHKMNLKNSISLVLHATQWVENEKLNS